MSLIEKSGYSFSGIVDIIRNDDMGTEFLLELDDKYNTTKKKQAELEKELERVKNRRSNYVSCFANVIKVLKIIDNPLTYINKNNEFVTVKIKNGTKDTIIYEKYPITYDTKLNKTSKSENND